MPNYDANFASPPAPIAHITIRNPAAGKSVVEVPMLIDIGADATLLPRAVLPFLGISEEMLQPFGYSLVGFDGTKSSAVMASLELKFLGRRLAGKYLLVEANYGVLYQRAHDALTCGGAVGWNKFERTGTAKIDPKAA